MNFKSCFWIASKMLFSNSWKIILPVLGILIGIASVITIYSIAEGGKAVVEKDLAFFAENRVMIGIVNENVSRKNYMDIKDIRLIESLPGVSYAYLPEYKISINNFLINGLTSKGILYRNLTFVSGDSYKLSENEILIDENLALEKFGTPYSIGKILELSIGSKKSMFIVKGVYKMDKSIMDIFSGEGIVDYRVYKNMIRNQPISRILISFEESEDAEYMSPMIISTLEKQHKKKGIYTILEASQKYKRVEKIKKTMNIFLAAIGIVSLAFGGIGISNLMVINVRERISQIGILRAMGASKNFILLLFLIKSFVISVFGGVLGLVSGYMVGIIVGKLIGIVPIFFLQQFILAFSVSALLGVIFGVVPARKAAYMDPLKALKINL